MNQVKAWIGKNRYVKFETPADALQFYAMYADREQFKNAYQEMHQEPAPADLYDHLRSEDKVPEMKRIQAETFIYVLRGHHARRAGTLARALADRLTL
jgi:hypothetical protein